MLNFSKNYKELIKKNKKLLKEKFLYKLLLIMDLIINNSVKLLNSGNTSDVSFIQNTLEMMRTVDMNILKNKYIKYATEMLKAGKHPNTHIQEYYNMFSIKEQKDESALAVFVTVSLSEPFTFEDLPKVIDHTKRMKKLFIDKYIFCLEQRGIDENYYGYHLHILCYLNKHKRKSHIINEFYNYFKKFITAKNYIDVRTNLKNLETIIEYMKGKKEENKMNKVYNDRLMRKKLNIEDIYIIEAEKPDGQENIRPKSGSEQA